MLLTGPWVARGRGADSAEANQRIVLTFQEDLFLDELQRQTWRFFDECSHPETGLVKDRALAVGDDRRTVASIAATGFGLTSLCVADQRGWLPVGEAARRAARALDFLLNRLPHQHGFFYHFVHWANGERVWKCELSSIDTALLLCGVLTCRQHFGDRGIHETATAIYERVDWNWMLNGALQLSHGWKPESGFLKARWEAYCEHMMLYLLALGASRPIPTSCWDAWKRPIFEYAGQRYINIAAPLFIHQFSHAWFDFRGRKDAYANYYENSVTATRAHRLFCLELKQRFPHFEENLWGITASDFKGGYVAWGGPPAHGPLDGTIVPCAAAGSVPFLPAECVRCLRTIKERHGSKVWQRYGFVDAFNPSTGWQAPDVIGIDAGITLVMAENARSGFVWETFMRNPEARRSLARAGFKPV
jgi:hypothetical protein